MYRLNVGGSSIKPSQDSYLWRTWEADSSYMINADAGSEIRNRSDITYANRTTQLCSSGRTKQQEIWTNTEVMEGKKIHET